jgi:hypothetical protein
MHQIDHATAAAALPAYGPAGVPGWFSDATPGNGTPTVVTNDWLNDIQGNLMGLLTAAGIAPVKGQHNQVLNAIQSIVGGSAVVGVGAIHGMQLAPAAGFETTRITTTAGLVRDRTNVAGGIAAAPMTKRLDALWAEGDGQGGRLSGALANAQTWFVFALIEPNSGAVEYGFHTSPTAPDMTLPTAAGYTHFRRLWAIVLEAAATTIRPFHQDGDWFEYKTRSTDFAVQSNGGGVAYYREFPGLPLGIPGRCKAYFQTTGTANATAYLSGLFSPKFGVPPAFGGAAQRATVRRVAAYQQASGADLSYGTVDFAEVSFDSTRHIYTFSSDNAGDVIAAGIIGWYDERGRFF